MRNDGNDDQSPPDENMQEDEPQSPVLSQSVRPQASALSEEDDNHSHWSFHTQIVWQPSNEEPEPTDMWAEIEHNDTFS